MVWTKCFGFICAKKQKWTEDGVQLFVDVCRKGFRETEQGAERERERES